VRLAGGGDQGRVHVISITTCSRCFGEPSGEQRCGQNGPQAPASSQASLENAGMRRQPAHETGRIFSTRPGGVLGVEQDSWVLYGILQACGVKSLMRCGRRVRMRCLR